MDTKEIIVVIAGVALVALVLWYFFGERERVAASARADGVQEIDITVKGGYSPDVVVVRQGSPVRLNFYRDETASCSDRVVFGDFHIARDLPAFKTTPVEFTPERAGEFTWTCGMNMMRGKLVVEPSPDAKSTRT
jgi:plastocyanin domain-containing protein